MRADYLGSSPPGLDVISIACCERHVYNRKRAAITRNDTTACINCCVATTRAWRRGCVWRILDPDTRTPDTWLSPPFRVTKRRAAPALELTRMSALLTFDRARTHSSEYGGNSHGSGTQRQESHCLCRQQRARPRLCHVARARGRRRRDHRTYRGRPGTDRGGDPKGNRREGHRSGRRHHHRCWPRCRARRLSGPRHSGEQRRWPAARRLPRLAAATTGSRRSTPTC